MRIALGSVLAILAVAAPLASAGPGKGGPAQISWADKQHRYGWAFSPRSTKGGWCPSRYATPRICATEDGGNHWRGILYGKFDSVPFILRSTTYAGVAVVRGLRFTFALGTIDNGRRWYRIAALTYGTGWRMRAGKIYWDENENRYSYRLGGWPPPRAKRANCRVGHDGIRWAPGIFSQGPRPNVCWTARGRQPVGAILGLSAVPVKAPDQSITSWADAKHGFATDPAGVKWRCTPKAARREHSFGPPTVLCRTDDGGKHWKEIFVLEEAAKRFDTVEWIAQVWRGPADDGVMVLAASGDGAGLDRTFVSHDAGQSWTYETAFYAGFNNYCDPATPVGTVCASGPTFDQTHGDPLQLVYSLNVCTSKDDYDFDTCQTQTYRMDGWPNGPLEPVKLSP